MNSVLNIVGGALTGFEKERPATDTEVREMWESFYKLDVESRLIFADIAEKIFEEPELATEMRKRAGEKGFV